MCWHWQDPAGLLNHWQGTGRHNLLDFSVPTQGGASRGLTSSTDMEHTPISRCVMSCCGALQQPHEASSTAADVHVLQVTAECKATNASTTIIADCITLYTSHISFANYVWR